MIGSTYLDPRALGALAEGPVQEFSSALVVALTEEVCTLRRAVISLVDTMEARSPGTREALLADLHEVIRQEAQATKGTITDAPNDAADYLFNAIRSLHVAPPA
ncbi:hypothetical protein [Solirhodobacter olei]|uniref:hypothetical protein n=1 Tax=Solirhodobacter olei TaxID=2493082 RepID=UPI000FDA734C|nr:hypothetical protein [Solirhodobacter olei]